MDDSTAGKLQIYSVEERDVVAATCIVRCVDGVVSTGQQFKADPIADATEGPSLLSLGWINRYGKMMDFIDPPHSATVYLSGNGVASLKRGVTLTSIVNDEPPSTRSAASPSSPSPAPPAPTSSTPPTPTGP